VGGIDSQGLLEDAKGRVAGDIESEETRRSDSVVVAEQMRNVASNRFPDQLIEEGGWKVAKARVSSWAVSR